MAPPQRMPFLLIVYYDREFLITKQELRFLHKYHVSDRFKKDRKIESVGGFTISKN